MGNTIKKMFAPRIQEGQQQPPQQQQQQPPQQQQLRQIHRTMPQITNLENIKPVSWKNSYPITKKGKPIVQLKTHITNENTPNINKNNKSCQIHSKFVFHFIRHAESCSNEQQRITTGFFNEYKKKIISGSEIEPFISNKGILDCNVSKNTYTQFLNSKKISNYFCSCLQRTWDTAYVLFGEDTIEKFMVGPYLKEDMKSPSNSPVLYNENVWRFNFFKEYANKFIENSNQPQPQPSSASQPQPNSTNSHQANRQNSKNCPRYSGDGSALYPPIYYESDLDKFILWYVENFKLLNKCNNLNKENEIHVVVVCHSHIIQEFVKKNQRMTIEKLNEQLKEKGLSINITKYDDYFKEYFNYCISVNVEYNTSQNTNKKIITKYNENYNKSLDLLQGSEYSNKLLKNRNNSQNKSQNKSQYSENIMKNMVPVCGFGNICVRKISIDYIGSNGKSPHGSISPSPICKYSKNLSFKSKTILSEIVKKQSESVLQNI